MLPPAGLYEAWHAQTNDNSILMKFDEYYRLFINFWKLYVRLCLGSTTGVDYVSQFISPRTGLEHSPLLERSTGLEQSSNRTRTVLSSEDSNSPRSTGLSSWPQDLRAKDPAFCAARPRENECHCETSLIKNTFHWILKRFRWKFLGISLTIPENI